MCVNEDVCCRSVNYRKNSLYDEKENCELLHVTSAEEPGHLEVDIDYDHYVLLHPNRDSTKLNCPDLACLNGGRCVGGCGNKTSFCNCSRSYTGKYCNKTCVDALRFRGNNIEEFGIFNGASESLTSLAACLWMNTTEDSDQKLLSYAYRDVTNGLVIWLKPNLIIIFNPESGNSVVKRQTHICCKDSFIVKTRLDMSANLRLSWAGDFDRLKEFVKSDLELQGSWSSPANEKKLFVSDNVELLWWKNKKFLKINGEDANRIKRCMINAMFTSLNLDSIKSGVDMATNTENSLNENQPTKHQCTGCECSKLSPDLEGLKLDLVVLESKLNHKIQAVENQILRMNDCRPKEPKNHANLENMLTTSTPISSGGTNKTKE
ncbi:Sushi, von Willebrand factor type A, EGF and pentraxin domain-containing 1, partial [Paramuricea clavata]